MRRKLGRSHILYFSLLLAALMLFCVPEAQVAALRGRTLSALSPALRLFAPWQRSHQQQVATLNINVPTTPVARPEEKPPQQEFPFAELDELRAKVQQLQSDNNHLRTALPGLGHALNLPQGIGAEVIARRVLLQEPVLGLNRGEADGVKLNAGVLHRGAVIGRIVAVGPHASSMALLTHEGMRIAVRLADCRVEGLLQGSTVVNGERLCKMAVVSRDLNSHVGESVITSYDSTFPPGFWVGAVASVRKVADVQWEVLLRPACNENAVECVHILTGAMPEVPWPVVPERRRR